MSGQPAMPSPARAADKSIAVAVRMGVPASEAPRVVAELTGVVMRRIYRQGDTDLTWLYDLQQAAIARIPARQPGKTQPRELEHERSRQDR